MGREKVFAGGKRTYNYIFGQAASKQKTILRTFSALELKEFQRDQKVPKIE
jgi:hypothetical protein